MAEAEENNEDDAKDFGEVRRARAPSKKKFDEEMEAVCAEIRKREEELKHLCSPSFAEAMKSLRAEKNSNIERRKQIHVDLSKLNTEITQMMQTFSRLESTLHYRSEDKIDEAIRRLESSLKFQNFKLSQEKKIVNEIDSLRRSKKTLMQYLSMKKEKDAMRDRQRRMRGERDHCSHKVTELKQKEEKLRAENVGKKARAEQLKKELDTLYEAKRQMVSVYKKQREDFYDDREKRRHESFKKRQEEKQALMAALRQERAEVEAERHPYEDEICLCNTLIHYLQRHISNTELDSSLPGVTATPSLPSPCSEESPLSASGPAERLEDGQYVLLRRSEDDNYVTGSARHAAGKKRRSRKQSLVKRITHTPEVLGQFMKLNLNAPATVAEIIVSLEQLHARKLHYEREAEVRSEAELSVTESSLLEMSRQASHTESTDGLTESQPGDHVIDQLMKLSVSEDFDFQGYDDPEGLGENCSDGVFHDGKWAQARSSFDSVEMNYLSSVDPSQDFLARSGGPDSSPSRSRSEGSGSLAQSSSTADGAWGGREEGHPVVDGVDADVQCDRVDGWPTGPVAMLCECGGRFLERCSHCNAVRDSSETLLNTIDQTSSSESESVPHICHGENCVAPSSSWNPVDRTTAVSTASLHDFPALVSTKGNDLSLSDRDRHGDEGLRLQRLSAVSESTVL